MASIAPLLSSKTYGNILRSPASNMQQNPVVICPSRTRRAGKRHVIVSPSVRNLQGPCKAAQAGQQHTVVLCRWAAICLLLTLPFAKIMSAIEQQRRSRYAAYGFPPTLRTRKAQGTNTISKV